MRIRCHCGHEFVTEDHDEIVDFSPEAVVGPLGPDQTRQRAVLSAGAECKACGTRRFSVATIELSDLTIEEKAALERLMMRLGQPRDEG
jgi:hypothetical protein